MKDITDHRNECGADATREFVNGAAPVPKAYTGNDAGRAERFVDRHFAHIRFVPAWAKWLIWQDHYWRPDDDGAIMRLALDHHRQLLREAADVRDDRARADAVQAAMEMGDTHTIKRMLELARVDGRIVARHDSLDADPFLLGVQNGVVELRTGEFRAGKPTDLITKRVGAPYVAEAACPRWVAFLDRVLASNGTLIDFQQRLWGYTLTGDTSEQIFGFLHGGGKNGKSVHNETAQALLGDYAQRAPQSLLTASNNGREPSHEIARLQGARLVIGSETEEGARLAESRVKDITGGDTLTGRFLYAEAFDFRPCLKLWMFGNHRPTISGTDEGIWRRMRLIPFTVHIPEAERDPHLPDVLRGELPGILQWALAGTRQWLERGLDAPSIVMAASEEYRREEDTLGDFLQDELQEAPGASVRAGEMFARYRAWCERVGYRYPLAQKALTKRLGERPGMVASRLSAGMIFRGVSLK